MILNISVVAYEATLNPSRRYKKKNCKIPLTETKCPASVKIQN